MNHSGPDAENKADQQIEDDAAKGHRGARNEITEYSELDMID